MDFPPYTRTEAWAALFGLFIVFLIAASAVWG